MRGFVRRSSAAILKSLILASALSGSAFAQQPQTYLQWTGDDLSNSLSGTTLTIGSGNVLCRGGVSSFAGATPTMTNSKVNYVYADESAACVTVGVNQSGFTDHEVPLFVVDMTVSPGIVKDVQPWYRARIGPTVLATDFPGTDACAQIQDAINALPGGGGVVDARGISAGLTCTTADGSTPPGAFTVGSSGSFKPVLVKLPAGTLVLTATITMYAGAGLEGLSPGNPGNNSDTPTRLQEASGADLAYLVDVEGDGVRVSNLTLDGNCPVNGTCHNTPSTTYAGGSGIYINAAKFLGEYLWVWNFSQHGFVIGAGSSGTRLVQTLASQNGVTGYELQANGTSNAVGVFAVSAASESNGAWEVHAVGTPGPGGLHFIGGDFSSSNSSNLMATRNNTNDSQGYVVGTYINDCRTQSSPCVGNVEEVTTAGTSGSSPPSSWASALHGTTTDGSVVWTNYGPAGDCVFFDGTGTTNGYLQIESAQLAPCPGNGINMVNAVAPVVSGNVIGDVGQQLASPLTFDAILISGTKSGVFTGNSIFDIQSTPSLRYAFNEQGGGAANDFSANNIRDANGGGTTFIAATSLDTYIGNSITNSSGIATGTDQISNNLTLPGGATLSGSSGSATLSAASTNEPITLAPSGNSSVQIPNNQLLTWADTTGVYARSYIYCASTGACVWQNNNNNSGGGLIFRNQAAGGESARFLSNGNFGIGTTGPALQLQVAKAMGSAVSIQSLSSNYTFDASSANTLKISLGGDVTLSIQSGTPVVGEILNFVICQPTSGSAHNFTWPTSGFTFYGKMSVLATINTCSAQSFVVTDSTHAYALNAGSTYTP